MNDDQKIQILFVDEFVKLISQPCRYREHFNGCQVRGTYEEEEEIKRYKLIVTK